MPAAATKLLKYIDFLIRFAMHAEPKMAPRYRATIHTAIQMTAGPHATDANANAAVA
jgi:hypothetical protein